MVDKGTSAAMEDVVDSRGAPAESPQVTNTEQPEAVDWLSSVLGKKDKKSSQSAKIKGVVRDSEDLLFENLSGTYSLLKSAKFKRNRFSRDDWREYRRFMVKAYKRMIKKKSTKA
ncbi:hypothetical protein BEWA_049260 [Theileria equi strain WA]|uniref:Uncharacterized protein n=1 Tax=Theileria equi strain WA TaxID=1537102 RepID=L1LB04_THEEQ|nr:hypothetical protein BEWA_049260 [Theileria equi strain WA]EKX72460.1 hypothetical protein BEWA_049260 [Theileria equi strain WA]|eukprot:XP_004831912.1 hypothetical protein BEWA_049260 [Theileria equi strain WA]